VALVTLLLSAVSPVSPSTSASHALPATHIHSHTPVNAWLPFWRSSSTPVQSTADTVSEMDWISKFKDMVSGSTERAPAIKEWNWISKLKDMFSGSAKREFAIKEKQKKLDLDDLFSCSTEKAVVIIEEIDWIDWLPVVGCFLVCISKTFLRCMPFSCENGDLKHMSVKTDISDRTTGIDIHFENGDLRHE
jgi:hypothetical protein